jgi:hypothetical protein
MAKKNRQKLIKQLWQRNLIEKSGAWSLMLKIWYHRQISNFGDGISFGH